MSTARPRSASVSSGLSGPLTSIMAPTTRRPAASGTAIREPTPRRVVRSASSAAAGVCGATASSRGLDQAPAGAQHDVDGTAGVDAAGQQVGVLLEQLGAAVTVPGDGPADGRTLVTVRAITTQSASDGTTSRVSRSSDSSTSRVDVSSSVASATSSRRSAARLAVASASRRRVAPPRRPHGLALHRPGPVPRRPRPVPRRPGLRRPRPGPRARPPGRARRARSASTRSVTSVCTPTKWVTLPAAVADRAHRDLVPEGGAVLAVVQQRHGDVQVLVDGACAARRPRPGPCPGPAGSGSCARRVGVGVAGGRGERRVHPRQRARRRRGVGEGERDAGGEDRPVAQARTRGPGGHGRRPPRRRRRHGPAAAAARSGRSRRAPGRRPAAGRSRAAAPAPRSRPTTGAR